MIKTHNDSPNFRNLKFLSPINDKQKSQMSNEPFQIAPEDFEMMMKKREQNHHLPNRTPSYPANRLSQGTYHIVQVSLVQVNFLSVLYQVSFQSVSVQVIIC